MVRKQIRQKHPLSTLSYVFGVIQDLQWLSRSSGCDIYSQCFPLAKILYIFLSDRNPPTILFCAFYYAHTSPFLATDPHVYASFFHHSKLYHYLYSLMSASPTCPFFEHAEQGVWLGAQMAAQVKEGLVGSRGCMAAAPHQDIFISDFNCAAAHA